MTSPSVLLTGVSSFTGTWFARTLAAQGSAVLGTATSGVADYHGLRSERLARAAESVEVAWDAPFGSERMLDVLAQHRPEVLCLHHAVVGDYRSPAFDIAGALMHATHRAAEVMQVAADNGCTAVMVTRSVFEKDAGLSDDPRPIGAYGVAKGATSQALELHARAVGLAVATYCIPNPFGPWEEPRLVAHLFRTWNGGGTPELRAPHLVRDNIPAPLLAHDYSSAVGRLLTDARDRSPSFRPCTNLEFARTLAAEFGRRLDRSFAVATAEELDDSEPLVRVGKDRLHPAAYDEQAFYDSYVNHYMRSEGRT